MKSPILEIKKDSFEAFKQYYEELKEKFGQIERHWKITQKLKKFAKENFDQDDFLGQGAYKTVYQFDDHTVLKIASPQDFKKMIAVYNSDYRNLVPDLKDGGKYWVLSEKVLVDGLRTYKEIFHNEMGTINQFLDGKRNYYTSYVNKMIMHYLSRNEIDRIASFFAKEWESLKPEYRDELATLYGPERTKILEENFVPVFLKAFRKNMSTFAKQIIEMSSETGHSIKDLHKDNVGITFDSKKPVIIDI